MCNGFDSSCDAVEMCTALLYCRCVLNWFGDWSTGALYQVGKEFTSKIDLEKTNVCVQSPMLYYVTLCSCSYLACNEFLFICKTAST